MFISELSLSLLPKMEHNSHTLTDTNKIYGYVQVKWDNFNGAKLGDNNWCVGFVIIDIILSDFKLMSFLRRTDTSSLSNRTLKPS